MFFSLQIKWVKTDVFLGSILIDYLQFVLLILFSVCGGLFPQNLYL